MMVVSGRGVYVIHGPRVRSYISGRVRTMNGRFPTGTRAQAPSGERRA
jgi:hypothetical protein